MRKLPGLFASCLILGVAGGTNAQIVINEILANPGSEFDGAEYVELYNPTGAPVSLAGWVLTGTEFNGTCGGEDHWQFPAGASIPAGGYIVVAKDNIDADTELEKDGFKQRFGGQDADFELYDSSNSHEFDDPNVPNLVLLTPSSFDDQLGFIPGSGYGATCLAFNQYEALYLYNGVPGSSTIIDVIEYRDPAACTSDVCLGIGASDNDALAVLPGVGEVICRDALGTDTNNSAADFHLGTNTPGSANIANPGPALSNLTLNNPDPKTGETVSVTIDATDPDGMGTPYVVYRVDGGAPDSVAMLLSGLDQYTGTIPAQVDDANVTYFVRAYDAGNAAGIGSSKYPDFSFRSIRWGTQDILSVQFHSPPTDVGFSSEVGKAVNIEGIVTTEPGLYNAGMFVIQSGTGPWNGVHCFDNTATTNVQRGDSVRVAGVVTEYFNLTEVDFFGSTSVEVLSSGNPLPPAQVLTASQLTTGSPFGELYEGVYSRIENVEVTNPNDGFGQWVVTDGTGSALIGDDAFYLYTPALGDSIDAVEGIPAYSFSERKLEPRDSADILGPPLVSNLRYSPIPPTSAGPVNFSALITDNGTITRAKLFYSTNNGASFDSTDLANTSGDIWEVALGPFADGTEIDYRVEVTDDTGFTGRSPTVGEFDLYVGLVDIFTIQSTFGVGDASAFAGSPRNVSGIVTMAPGTLADNIFVIQNHWTTDPSYRGIHVFSGGSLVGQIQLGDSVSVCGDVEEFFGLTQIGMHFTASHTNHGFVGELPGYGIASSSFPPDPIGAVGEPWEGVLIQVSNAVVTNAAAGFGQYFVDNTDPRNGEETLVDDEARISGLTFAPTLGDSVTVRGIGDFSFDQYKIQPRTNSDILPYDPADAVGVAVGAGTDLGFALHQNTPNPFSVGATRIGFALPRDARTTLRVFDVQGRVVRTLVDGPLSAGRHDVTWDGRNEEGRQVATGVYFYRLTAEQDEATRKLLLLK
jgi:hypothetical protein